jgi:hypothetical protein
LTFNRQFIPIFKAFMRYRTVRAIWQALRRVAEQICRSRRVINFAKLISKNKFSDADMPGHASRQMHARRAADVAPVVWFDPACRVTAARGRNAPAGRAWRAPGHPVTQRPSRVTECRHGHLHTMPNAPAALGGVTDIVSVGHEFAALYQ